MNVRDLYGMTYKAIELEHDVSCSMSDVLEEFAHLIRTRRINGYIEQIHTASHPDDESMFLTTLIYVLH